jgi:phosphate transport system protein
MNRAFDQDLASLKQSLLDMGAHVQLAIGRALEGLTERRIEALKEVHDIEKKINLAHTTIDEDCVRILARQSPLASDLRWVVAAIKINTDLERMGDQAVNIASNGERYLGERPLKPLIDLPQMALEVRKMVRAALDAFVRADIDGARSVLRMDDKVDHLKHQIFRELIEYMGRDATQIEAGLDLILISRNLERLGDHATNIAEDVIFAVSGLDVRHRMSGL